MQPNPEYLNAAPEAGVFLLLPGTPVHLLDRAGSRWLAPAAGLSVPHRVPDLLVQHPSLPMLTTTRSLCAGLLLQQGWLKLPGGLMQQGV